MLRVEPGAERFIRRFFGPDEFIKGKQRFCLWLVDASPNELPFFDFQLNIFKATSGIQCFFGSFFLVLRCRRLSGSL